MVASRLSEMGETAMSPSTSEDMTDVDMASIAEVELSEKFSVQGTSTGKISGKKKVVSFAILFLHTQSFCFTNSCVFGQLGTSTIYEIRLNFLT